MQAFKFVAPAIQRISDRLERFAVANDVADYLGVDEKLVRDHFSKGTAEHRVVNRGPEVPPNERLLLNSLLASEQARAEVLPALREMPVVDRFVTKGVFKALFSLPAEGVPFRLADLEGRLGEADRDLLSAVIFADEALEEEKAAVQASACLLSLKAQDPKAEVAALRSQIKAAEREGNFAEAMRLSALVVEFDQQRKKSRDAASDVVH
jgi:DNA primase